MEFVGGGAMVEGGWVVVEWTARTRWVVVGVLVVFVGILLYLHERAGSDAAWEGRFKIPGWRQLFRQKNRN